jgi:pimeloyl-CoA synthetase
MQGLELLENKDFYNHLMYRIQEKLVAINELKESNETITQQAGELAILSKILALKEGANEKVLNEKINILKKQISF